MTANGKYIYLMPERFNAIEQLSQTATQIALQNFVWDYATFVFFNSTMLFGVELFLQSYKKNTIVGKGTFYPKFVDMANQYVIFGLSIAEIAQVLDWMQDHEFDNTRKFIVVCQSQDLEDCEEKKAVKTLWAHKVINVVYLKSVNGDVLGYTYFPLEDSDCKTDVPQKISNLCSSFNETQDKFCFDIFSPKLQNFNTCPLLASSFIQTPYLNIKDGVPRGANGDLLIILAEGLNASLEVMTPRIGNGWGKIDEDGSWSGSLADLYYDYANLSITSAALTLSRFSSFQMSIDYSTAGVVWVTHPARMMPSSLKLTRPFQTNTQIAVLMCFMVVVIYAMLSKSRLCHGKTSRPRSSILFYSWMMCMGLPSTKVPTKAAYVYIMLLWMWFCIFIRTFYQVSLMTVLKANYYFDEFQTIDDAIAANYPFGGGSALKDYYIDHPAVYNQWTNVKTDDIIPMLRNVSEGVEFVLAMSMETAHTIIATEKIKVHILPQKIVSSPTVIFFKKFSPFASAVNNILVKLVESGFSDKFKQVYCSSPHKHKSENNLEPIKLNHYTSCYVVLLTGWFLSSIFFVGEILLYRMHKKNLNKNVITIPKVESVN